MTPFHDLAHDITTIDTGLVRPGFTASHLIIEKDEAAFVDVAATAQCSRLTQVLAAKGVAPEQVRYLVVTHVHLDHAGSAGTLLPHFPNALIVVHPRGARHLIDPEKLMAGATAVYGEELLHNLFGAMVPAPPERVLPAEDETILDLAGRRLLIRHTDGHARHHLCVVDERSQGIFTGDTFGLSYREFDTEQGHFIFPATAPVQFEPDAMHASIDLLMDYRPERVYLTHFGQVTDVARLAERLRETIAQCVEIAQNIPPYSEERYRTLFENLEQLLLAKLSTHGCTLPTETIRALLRPDLELNVMGLEVWLDRLQKQQKNA